MTGGASGIGLETVRALANGGAQVWIMDRSGAALDRAAESTGATACLVDVTDASAIHRALDTIPTLDILVANAGVGEQASLDDTSQEIWNRTIAVNLTGVFLTVQAAAGRMKRGSGSIVITASTNSFDGEANLIAYNASKAGLLGIVHTAANELGPRGIRVNAVCPGLIRTPLTESHFADPSYLKEYFRGIPLGRGGEAGEVANCIAFLASDLASYVTGTTLLVDGGQMCTKFATWNEECSTYGDGRWTSRSAEFG